MTRASAHSIQWDRTMSLQFLVFLTLNAGGAFALTCLKCDAIAQPRHCRQVVECAWNERCYTEKTLNSFGEYVYNLGCLQTTECSRQSHNVHTSCAECCSNNLCNAAGCGQPGFPLARGPICYNCPLYLDPSRCHNIDFCTVGEVCRLSGRLEFNEIVLTSSCSAKDACTDILSGGSISVGRREASQHKRSHQQHACDGCCTSDLCNRNCTTASLMTTAYPTGYPTTYSTQTTYTWTYSTYPWSTGSAGNFQDCQEILDAGYSKGDGLYTINWNGNHDDVYCDMTTDGGGWTVFQYRYDGTVDFYRNFTDYETGFGFYPGEFWQGLKWLNWITNQKPYALRVDLTAANGTKGHGTYSTFSIGNPDQYVLSVSGFSGNIGDKMNRQVGESFSTYDKDQDGSSGTDCAKEYHGAWWFESCFDSNLNGGYSPGSTTHSKMIWAYWPNRSEFYLGLKGSRMAIRPR